MNQGGLKLFFALLLGFLLIQAGITGKLGSMIGAIIDPADMVDISQIPFGAPGNTGAGQGTS